MPTLLLRLPLLLLLTLTGCIVLPIPHQRLHRFGISAQIVDAATNLPLPNATVESQDLSFESSAPNPSQPSANGSPTELLPLDKTAHLTITPQYGWHAAYLIGPIPMSLLPGLDMVGFYGQTLHISAPGYQPRTFTIVLNPHRIAPLDESDPTKREVIATQKGDCINSPPLKLFPLSTKLPPPP